MTRQNDATGELTLAQARENVLNRANRAFREKLEWIVDWYQQDTKNNLVSRWELGCQVLEIYRDQTEKQCNTGHLAFSHGGIILSNQNFKEDLTVRLYIGRRNGSQICRGDLQVDQELRQTVIVSGV